MSRRHREVIKAWKSFFEKGGATTVVEEPLLPMMPAGASARPSTTLAPDARADIAVRGLSVAGRDDFFDVAILDTGADTYARKPTERVLREYEERKRGKYADRVAAHGAFTPLICSIYGTLAPAAATTAHRVARRADPDREECDATIDLHAVIIQTAVIKATSLCLRARSWTQIPVAPAGPDLSDAIGRMGVVGPRDEP